MNILFYIFVFATWLIVNYLMLAMYDLSHSDNIAFGMIGITVFDILVAIGYNITARKIGGAKK